MVGVNQVQNSIPQIFNFLENELEFSEIVKDIVISQYETTLQWQDQVRVWGRKGVSEEVY